MAVLHVVQQGAELRLRGDTIGVWCEGEQLSVARVPLLEAVVLHGRVQLTTPVLTRLLAEGIDCVFLTQQGRFRGRLEALASTAAQLRARQAWLVAHLPARLAVARAIARHKIIAEWRVLHALRCPSPLPLRWALNRCREARTIAEVQGTEGYATRRYFEALRHVLPPAFRSWRRRRRPAPDGLNALLGYGYAILQSRVHAAVGTVGLDPYLGFLHQLGRPRPAFVLDMLEEFRAPIVDFTCVRLVRRWGSEGWWETTEEGARLSEEAKRALIASLEQRLARHTVHAPTRTRVTWTRAIELQVRGLAAALTRGVDRYRPVRPARRA